MIWWCNRPAISEVTMCDVILCRMASYRKVREHDGPAVEKQLGRHHHDVRVVHDLRLPREKHVRVLAKDTKKNGNDQE